MTITLASNYTSSTPLSISVNYIGGLTPKLDFNVGFNTAGTTTTMIDLPSGFANATKLYKLIKNLRLCKGSTGTIKPTKDPAKWIVTHEINSNVNLCYSVYPPFPEDEGIVIPKMLGYPIIRSNYFFYRGGMLFVLPEIYSDNVKIPIHLSWNDSSKSIVEIYNSFGETKTGLPQNNTTTMKNLLESTFLGGTFNKSVKTKGTNRFVLISPKKWLVSGDTYLEQISNIVSDERTFWNDNNYPFYLVTMFQTTGKGSSGFEGNRAFLIYNNPIELTPSSQVNWNNFKFLVAHEAMHNWITAKLGIDDHKEFPSPITWFQEGFTDYFSMFVLMKNHIVTFQQYIDNINKSLANYYTSPLLLPGEQPTFGTSGFDNMYFVKFQYYIGLMFAIKWNEELTERNSSLSKFIKELYQDSLKKKMILTNNTLSQRLGINGAITAHDDINRYVLNYNTMLLKDFNFEQCVKLMKVRMNRWDPGFDYWKSIKKKYIYGVTDGNVAYNNGLRNNDKILNSNIVYGNEDKKLTITVERNGKKLSFQYIPVSKTNTYQFKTC